eukprot:1465853-Amphidinium_carterae.1
MKVLNWKPKEGLELWRSLAREYEPKIGSRSASLLVQRLQYKFDGGNFQSSLEKWESLIKHYDGTVAKGKKIQRTLKVATLLAQIRKGYLQEHLLVNASRLKTNQRRNCMFEAIHS